MSKYVLYYGQIDDNGITQKTITFDDPDYAILIYRYQVKEYKEICGDNCYEECSDINEETLEEFGLYSYIYEDYFEGKRKRYFVELARVD